MHYYWNMIGVIIQNLILYNFPLTFFVAQAVCAEFYNETQQFLRIFFYSNVY